jgi:hypothetical protein
MLCFHQDYSNEWCRKILCGMGAIRAKVLCPKEVGRGEGDDVWRRSGGRSVGDEVWDEAWSRFGYFIQRLSRCSHFGGHVRIGQ